MKCLLGTTLKQKLQTQLTPLNSNIFLCCVVCCIMYRVFKNELRNLMREKMRTSKGIEGTNSLTTLIVNFMNSMLRHPSIKLSSSGDHRPIAWLDFVTSHLELKFGVSITEVDEKELMTMDLSPIFNRFCEKMEISLEYLLSLPPFHIFLTSPSPPQP